MRLTLSLFLLTLTTVQAQAQQPFDCAGVFGRDSGPEAVVEAFGEANVYRGEIWGDEGTSPEASVIFPNDPTQRLSVIWDSSETRARPSSIFIGGGSTWTVDGLQVGMSIAEVEALNDKRFNMGGFNDIDRGRVVDWDGGALALSGLDCRVDVQFGYAFLGLPTTLADPVESEGSYPSDDPVFQALGPKVTSIVISFPVTE